MLSFFTFLTHVIFFGSLALIVLVYAIKAFAAVWGFLEGKP